MSLKKSVDVGSVLFNSRFARAFIVRIENGANAIMGIAVELSAKKRFAQRANFVSRRIVRGDFRRNAISRFCARARSTHNIDQGHF